MSVEQPLLIAIYAGPGTGKSTTSAAVFAELKQSGVNAELVHEFAKDLTWEKRWVALGHQPYIAGKQMFMWDRLAGNVDCVVTDTSTLIGLLYGQKEPPEFKDWLVADYKRRNTLNIFLQRDDRRPYNPAGRRQSEESARSVDVKLKSLLVEHGIPFTTVEMGPVAAAKIYTLAMERLR